MFVYFLQTAVSFHLSIDFGSYYTKSSIVNRSNQPSISENHQSKRLTPTFLGFRFPKGLDLNKKEFIRPDEIYSATSGLGDQALSYMSIRPHFGAGYFPYFLDLNEKEAEKFSKKVFANKTITRFPFLDSISFFLKSYVASIASPTSIDNIAFIVPATYTVMQRKILEDASRNANLSVGYTIDDIEAVSTLYSIEKLSKFLSENKTILFVDVGATSVKSYAVTFSLLNNSGQLSVKNERHSYAISSDDGGAFVTSRMVNHFIKKHKIKKPTDVQKRVLFMACEKIKASLTLTSKTQFVAEELINSSDVTLTMTRMELEPLVEPLLNSIGKVVKSAMGDYNVSDVEIIGGSSRIPIVGEFIQNITKINTSHSLNGDEAVALGGGYALQYRISSSRYQMIQSNNTYQPFNINVTYNGESKVGCSKNNECEKFLSFSPESNNSGYITIEYDARDLPLNTGTKMNYSVTPIQNFTLTAVFSSDPYTLRNGIFCLNGSNCTSAPIRKPLSPPASDAFHSLQKVERERKSLGEAKSMLEQYVSKVSEDIEYDEKIKIFSTELELFSLKSLVSSVREWINDDSLDHHRNLTDYNTKLQEVKEHISKITGRIETNSTLTDELRRLKLALEIIANTTKHQISELGNKLNSTNITRLFTKINQTRALYDRLIKMRKETPINQDIVINTTEIRETIQSLFSEVQSLIRNTESKKNKGSHKSSASDKSQKSWYSKMFGKLGNIFKSKKKNIDKKSREEQKKSAQKTDATAFEKSDNIDDSPKSSKDESNDRYKERPKISVESL